MTEAQARSRPCPGQQNFVFAKQGSYYIGASAPKPGPDGEVPTNTISNMGVFSTVLRVPGALLRVYE
jgi:hypothetical protein